MTTVRKHQLPEDLPPSLDFRVPPAKPTAARHYAELVAQLAGLGDLIDRGGISPAELRGWERDTLPLLTGAESDALFVRNDEADWSDATEAAEHRWRNMRKILLRRKGISV